MEQGTLGLIVFCVWFIIAYIVYIVYIVYYIIILHTFSYNTEVLRGEAGGTIGAHSGYLSSRCKQTIKVELKHVAAAPPQTSPPPPWGAESKRKKHHAFISSWFCAQLSKQFAAGQVRGQARRILTQCHWWRAARYPPAAAYACTKAPWPGRQRERQRSRRARQ